MADDQSSQDDIQINPSSQDTGTAPTSGAPAAGSPGSGTPGGTAKTGSHKPATPPAQKPGAAQSPGGDEPAAEEVTPPKKKGAGFDLEEAALMGEEQTMAPPEKFTVPKLVREKFPDLIDLIKSTESMNEEERDYWFQILPIMTEEQIAKFRDILVSEKEQLDRLDKEYEEELSRLNEKHMIEWKEFETKEKRAEIAGKEKKAEVEEKATEEELLKKLQEM